MRVFRYVLFASICLGFLLCLDSPLIAADFTDNCSITAPCTPAGSTSPACDETTASLGKFRIYIAPRFRALFGGMYPGYEDTSCTSGNILTAFRLESPCLFDTCTKIGRSVAHTQGSTGLNSDTGGTPVGDAGNCPLTSCVSDSSLTFPLGWSLGPSSSRREIHTEIVTLNLVGPYAGGTLPSVRAGSLAPTRPKSFGEVQSKCNPLNSSCIPNAVNDLPADSFFDVFVEVDLPMWMPPFFPGGTVYNLEPLLVLNDNVETLPPTVVYIHGNSSMVPVYFKDPGPPNPIDPAWDQDDLLGYLVLAGHGVGYASCDCEGLPASLTPPRCFKDVYCDQAQEMTGLGGCCLPNGTCEMLDLQGCTDIGVGGHYLGDGTPCTKCGACCRDTNRCDSPVSDIECLALPGGFFMGNGSTSCTHNPDGSCKCGACCLPANGCALCVNYDACVKLGGRYLGDGTTSCAHDAAGDCIPTVSEWGLLVMAVLVLTAATVVIMRRRAMVHGGS